MALSNGNISGRQQTVMSLSEASSLVADITPNSNGTIETNGARAVVNHTQSQNLFFAVVISSCNPDFPAEDQIIAHICTQTGRARYLAMLQLSTQLFKYNQTVVRSTEPVLGILHVDEDYPTPAYNALGDPTLPTSYDGDEPNARHWAVCQQFQHDHVEIYVRFLTYPSDLRWIKTRAIEIAGQRSDADCHPPYVYTTYYHVSPLSEDDDIISLVQPASMTGAYWSKSLAEAACRFHMENLELQTVRAVEVRRMRNEVLHFDYVIEHNGQQHKWFIQVCACDETQS